MRKRAFAAAATAAVLAILSVNGASANDSSAVLGAGGLEFTRNDAVQMKSEDLFISQDEVRVRYVFRNVSSAPVELRVAFALPDIGPEFQEAPVNLPTPGDSNFVNFRTTVDGQPVPLELERRARVDGRNVTAALQTYRLPLNPADGDIGAACAALSPTVISGLERDGIVEVERDGGQVVSCHPNWTLSTTYHRMQVFQPGRDVVVEHRYQPVVGGSVQALLVSEGLMGMRAAQDDQIAEYCAEPSFVNAARRMAQTRGGPQHVGERSLRYVLTTGANWAGPIADFRLVVDKGAPGNLVSLCFDGIRRISPTQFEARRTNFTPTRDLDILILIPQ